MIGSAMSLVVRLGMRLVTICSDSDVATSKVLVLRVSGHLAH